MMVVKIWYWSGAFEQLPPTDDENARAYMAEAENSTRVEAAEAHQENGCLAYGFRHRVRPVTAHVLG